MLKIKLKHKSFDDYRKIIQSSLYNEVKSLAKNLKDKKVIHINSTAIGGGVAEILQGLVPLMRDVGLNAEWLTLSNDELFFEITKEFHNCLQGKKWEGSSDDFNYYLKHIKKIFKKINKRRADFWIIHDPQPVALIKYLKTERLKSKFIWRCHIDTSKPAKEVWYFLSPFIMQYDNVIFSLDKFVDDRVPKDKYKIFTPAIDPLSEKNLLLSKVKAREIIKKFFNIPVKVPLILQVGRFDPWKDPIGTIEIFSSVKNYYPKAHLVFIGLNLAQDDAGARAIYLKTKKAAKNISNVHLFFNPNDTKEFSEKQFVRIFQSAADVVLQKSLREGFGLAVTEAMWKAKPVIGGNVGGIKEQIDNGKNGFLVKTNEQAVLKIKYLLSHPKQSEKMGLAARETIRKKFLLPRLLRDYLKLLN